MSANCCNPTMGAVGVAALLANAASFALLWAYSAGDSNMRSVWLCSRNDVIGNFAALLAALGVFNSGKGWPDIFVALAMACFALQGAWRVIRLARAERMNAIKLSTSLLFCLINLSAQPVAKEPEPVAIVELGGAAGRDLKGGGSSFGGDLALEFTPIEKWLEIEVGITPLFRSHSTEWDTDLLLKKPWTFSEKVEFMVGVGPVWTHTRAYGVTANSLGGGVVLDFMFWPSSKHRFGWFLEPAYDYSFARGHERSIGISGGLLIAIPRKR